MYSSSPEKLIFIYNADSGIRNMIVDGAHKILSPTTYECNLCDITYGVFIEDKVWKNFREGSTLHMEFLHRDEFKKQYASKFGHKFTFPIILAVVKGNLEVVISTKELDAMQNSFELIEMLEKRVMLSM